MSAAVTTTFKEITTDIPARMDRLPWSNFHLLVVIALGVTWVLDGLEVTLVGSIGPILRDKQTLSLTDQDIGNIAACYVGGAVVGALLFGWLTDRFGRRLIFNLTLGIYMVGVLLTAFAWNFWSFACFNCITGLGIGGEYAAINFAIDELIPARLRGRIDLIVNGSYWAGAAVGAAGSLLLLSGRLVSLDIGWRLGFGIGAVLSGFILFLRRYVPESPRWQITHGREEEAKQTTGEIERKIGKDLAVAGLRNRCRACSVLHRKHPDRALVRAWTPMRFRAVGSQHSDVVDQIPDCSERPWLRCLQANRWPLTPQTGLWTKFRARERRHGGESSEERPSWNDSTRQPRATASKVARWHVVPVVLAGLHATRTLHGPSSRL